MGDVDYFFASLEHPYLTTIHPWVLGIATVLLGVSVVMALRRWFKDGFPPDWRPFLVAYLMLIVTKVCDPTADDTTRIMMILSAAAITPICIFPLRFKWKPFLYLSIGANLLSLALRGLLYLKSGLTNVTISNLPHQRLADAGNMATIAMLGIMVWGLFFKKVG